MKTPPRGGVFVYHRRKNGSVRPLF